MPVSSVVGAVRQRSGPLRAETCLRISVRHWRSSRPRCPPWGRRNCSGLGPAWAAGPDLSLVSAHQFAALFDHYVIGWVEAGPDRSRRLPP